MSKNILQQLFDGEIYPSESLCFGKPEYTRISKALADTKKRFVQNLSDADGKEFEKMEDLYNQLTSLYSYEGFVSGYRTGVTLLHEGLKETDNPTQDTAQSQKQGD